MYSKRERRMWPPHIQAPLSHVCAHDLRPTSKISMETDTFVRANAGEMMKSAYLVASKSHTHSGEFVLLFTKYGLCG
jgi:hypothetical protein